MTDLFVEQPEEQLYSTLAPDEKPDPMGELSGAFSDYSELFGSLWRQEGFEDTDWYRPDERIMHVVRGVRDLLTQEGQFTPEEVDTSAEGLSAQRAQDILPAKSEDLADDAGDAALKALHFETMPGEAAFVKFINWLGRSGVTMVSREGAPLGEAVIYEETASGARQPSLAFQGGTQGSTTANVVNLRSDAGEEELIRYLRSDWRNIPDLLELVQQNIATNWSEFMAATLDGKRPETFGVTEENPDVFGELMRQFGGYGDGTTLLVNVDEMFGGGSAQDILGGTLVAAITA